jgi:methionyl-tRNA formyltransferase
MKKTFNIIFMGTPEYAVPSLKAIHNSRHHLSLVITQPDRPKGRGRKVFPPPVKRTATDLGYEVIQPTKIKTPEFVESIARLNPDIFVVVAYGRILPKQILDIPNIGPINVHASILPKYRGPAPIQWAVINGETETGITTILMDEGMDTGDVLMTAKETVRPDDTAATLHDRLARLGAEVLSQTLERLAQDEIRPVDQDHSLATSAPMLKKSDGQILWEKPAQQLDAFIRGMTPWPGAFTFHGRVRLKIFKAKINPSATSASPGTVVEGFADELRVATGEGLLSILEIQGESGKQLPIRDFLHGYKIPPGTVLK